MKFLSGSLFSVLLTSISAYANVSIEIDAGILRNANGSSVVPTNGLLELIATRSGSATNFAAPTPGSFSNGDNLVVAYFPMNSTFGPGETDSRVTFTLENTSATASSTTFDAGDPLLLRWFPTLTYNTSTGLPSRSPQANDPYGEFRSNTGEGGGIAWFTPADQSNLGYPNGLNFLTSDTTDAANNPGPHAPSTGFASLTVSPVPEPSTYALLGLGLGGLTFGVMQQRRRRQVAG